MGVPSPAQRSQQRLSANESDGARDGDSDSTDSDLALHIIDRDTGDPTMISFRLPAWLRSTPVLPRQAQEREHQRAARLQEVTTRIGRDEQRSYRANSHTSLVVSDRATADEVMREIAATPILAGGLGWPVQMWDEDAGTAIGTIEASDGRSRWAGRGPVPSGGGWPSTWPPGVRRDCGCAAWRLAA